MATTQLADIIDVIVFNDLPAEDTPELTALFQSGAVVRSELFDRLANADGKSVELPFWRDVDHTTEPNYSSDQATLATPDKIQQDEQKAVKNWLNKGWSAMDLTVELASGDPMRRIRSRVDSFWAKHWQHRVVAAALGVMNANINGNFATQSPGTAGDMVYNIASESIAGQSAATRFSRAAFVSAAFTLGDHVDDVRAVAVHSVIYKKMIDNDDIDFIPDSQGALTIPTFLGKRVIVDDGMPVIAGSTDGFKYVTILFGPAVFAYGEGTPTVMTEVWRSPQAGHGGGEEQLWTRRSWMLHPFGHTNTNTTHTANANQQNIADLKLQANWKRVLTRKNVPLAYLITN